MKKDIIILYSGWMDSTTAMYEFAEEIALAISFNYGSKHNAKEIEYACIQTNKEIYQFYKDYFDGIISFI
jgi:7-cyano-7-deazaguanine synthase